MAFFAAALPFIQQGASMLMEDDAQKKRQNLMVQRGSVNTPEPPQDNTMGVMGGAISAMQGAKGMGQSKSDVLSDTLIKKNPKAAIYKAREIFQRNPDLGQQYGTYIDQWEKTIS